MFCSLSLKLFWRMCKLHKELGYQLITRWVITDHWEPLVLLYFLIIIFCGVIFYFSTKKNQGFFFFTFQILNFWWPSLEFFFFPILLSSWICIKYLQLKVNQSINQSSCFQLFLDGTTSLLFFNLKTVFHAKNMWIL